MNTQKIKRTAREYFAAEENAAVIPEASKIKAYTQSSSTVYRSSEAKIHRKRKIKLTAIIAAAVAIICISAMIPAFVNTDSHIDVSENIVLPPTRVGASGQMSASIDKSRTFQTAFEESDVVALIEIGNWLYEEEGYTCFDATVIEQYKGNAIDNLVVREDGNSDFTFKGSPLFTYGNKMLLFLSEVTDETVDNYWIVGSFSTIIDAVIIDGDWYFLDRLGMLTTETLGISKDPYSVDDMSKKVNAAYRESDEFAEANGYYTPYVYTRDEITSRINRFDGFVERIVKNEK